MLGRKIENFKFCQFIERKNREFHQQREKKKKIVSQSYPTISFIANFIRRVQKNAYLVDQGLKYREISRLRRSFIRGKIAKFTNRLREKSQILSITFGKMTNFVDEAEKIANFINLTRRNHELHWSGSEKSRIF